MANSSVSTIIGYGLQAAKVGDSTRIPGLDTSVALVRVVDRENRNFMLAPDKFNQPGWDFAIDEWGYTIQSSTTTTGALTSASTTIPVTSLTIFAASVVDSSVFTTAGGAAVIYKSNVPDTVLYGGASASSGAGNLTTATKISFSHASGDAIYALYQMPTNFRRPRAEKYRGDGVSLDTIPYYYGGTGEPIGSRVSLFYDAATSRSYVWLPRDVSGEMLVRYDKAPTSITLNTQTVDVIVDYEEYLIQKVAAHVLRILSKDDSKILDAEMQAQEVLNTAFARRSINKKVQLVRGPIRSPSSLADSHFMTSSGDIY